MRRLAFSVLLLAAALTATAVEPTISDVAVRTLWPWSGEVDIAFTVAGTNTAVTITAQYDGVAPFVLEESALTGDFFDAAPGRCHVRWNPLRAGITDTIVNFRVLSVVPDPTDRTYLVLNLRNGSYCYMAEEPEGGWKNASAAYYQTNMVFRRVPGGTFTMGYPKEMRERIDPEAGSHYMDYMAARRITLSSDCYVAVYMTTVGQHICATNSAAGGSLSVASKDPKMTACSYNSLRGTVAGDGIDWPNTQYAVAEDSVIAAYRKVVAKTFSPDWIIDLPTAAQWSRAARATTPTNQYWSVGGTVDSTGEELTNFVNQVAVWKGIGSEDVVGQLAANGWGFYDFCGLGFEWALDWVGWYGAQTDPVGPASHSRSYRCRCGSYRGNSKYICWTVPGFIYYYGASSGVPGYRLCIHLKNLFKDK